MAGIRKIGWYVHYTAEGYEKHGVSIDSRTDPRPSLSEASKMAREQIKSKAHFFSNTLTQKQVKFLEQILSLSKKTPDQKDWLEKVIIQELTDLHQSAMDKVVLDFSTGKVTMNAQWAAKLSIKSGDVSLDKISQKIQQLQTHLASYLQILGRPSELTKRKEELNSLEAEYNALKNSAAQAAPDSATIAALAEKINQFMINNNFEMPPIHLIKGELFELLYYHIPDFIEQYAENEIENYLMFDKEDKEWTGSHHITHTIHEGNFVKSDFNISTTSGKVDAIITLKDGDQSLFDSSNRLRASMKNYTLSNRKQQRWVSLGSAPLSYMVQEVNHDFVNHFLNIYAKHYQEKGSGQRKRLSLVQSDRINFRTTLIYTLLFGALTNATASNSVLDEIVGTLIINDASRGVAKVWTVEDFMQWSEKYLPYSTGGETSKGLVSVKFGTRYLSSIATLFENKWYEGSGNKASLARARIASVLAQMHGMHVTVKLNPLIIRGQIK